MKGASALGKRPRALPTKPWWAIGSPAR